MSDVTGDQPDGPNALTPFEFALAGVEPPGAASRSSLRVIGDMRSLLDGMDDIPVSHHGLQDFLHSGGLVARRRERRHRSRHPVTPISERAESGAFIDITPPDMADPARNGDHEVTAVATSDPAGGTDPSPSTYQTEPTDPTDPETPADLEPIDLVQADLRLVLRQHTPLVDDVGDHLSEDLVPGPVSDHAEVAALASTTDRLRDDVGRFGPLFGPHLDPADRTAVDATPASTAEPVIESIDDGEDRAVAVSAVGGAAPGVLEQSSASGPPLTTPATRAVVASSGRRPAGTVLALVGAGAAAAVLIAGSLWWATSNDSSSTEAEGADSDVAAAPSTTTAELAAGSLSGPAERSTGDDDEPAEFEGDEDDASSSAAPGGTIQADAGAERTGSTTGRSTTTATRSGTGGATTGATVASTGGVSTSEASSTTTTRAPTTAPVTTRSPATTVRRATTATVAPERPVSIGDRVTVGNDEGPGLGGVEVSLYIDNNRDGRVERRIARRTTNGDGSYSFDEPPGCYEVRFSAPAGYRIQPDLSRQYLCLDSGAVATRTDAIAEPLTSDPPSGCLVEEAGNSAGLGVEVYENASDWAPSYTFYNRSGGVVVRTRDLGPFDTDDGDPTDREWFGAENGFDHRSVWSVAAERNGIESTPLTCRRDD